MLIPAYRNPGRVDVPEHEWHLAAGTHYHNLFNSATAPAGWTHTGTPSALTASTGDFNSSADHSPVGLGLNTVASAQSLRFQSLLFGTYAQWATARDILGYEPTKLCFKLWASFAINTANEANTGFGLVTTSAATTANSEKIAWVHSDGTNFTFRENTNTDAGAAKDTAFHEYIIKIDATNMEWFIDGVSQGTLSTPTDKWGAAFQANGAAGRTNSVQVSSLLVWYE